MICLETSVSLSVTTFCHQPENSVINDVDLWVVSTFIKSSKEYGQLWLGETTSVEKNVMPYFSLFDESTM